MWLPLIVFHVFTKHKLQKGEHTNNMHLQIELNRANTTFSNLYLRPFVYVLITYATMYIHIVVKSQIYTHMKVLKKIITHAKVKLRSWMLMNSCVIRYL